MTTPNLDALAKLGPFAAVYSNHQDAIVIEGAGSERDFDDIAAALNEWAELRAYRERTEAERSDMLRLIAYCKPRVQSYEDCPRYTQASSEAIPTTASEFCSLGCLASDMAWMDSVSAFASRPSASLPLSPRILSSVSREILMPRTRWVWHPSRILIPGVVSVLIEGSSPSR